MKREIDEFLQGIRDLVIRELAIRALQRFDTADHRIGNASRQASQYVQHPSRKGKVTSTHAVNVTRTGTTSQGDVLLS